MAKEGRIVAVVPFWNRIEVSKIFWDNIKHQKERGLNIEVVAVVSEVKNIMLAKKHTQHVIECSNNNIGDKWNKGIEYTRQFSYDYLLIIGSDDIFSKDLIDLYLKRNCDYIGLEDATAISLYSKQFRHFDGYKTKRRGESVGNGS